MYVHGQSDERQSGPSSQAPDRVHRHGLRSRDVEYRRPLESGSRSWLSHRIGDLLWSVPDYSPNVELDVLA